MTTVRVTAVNRILLALTLLPIATVARAQEHPSEGIVVSDGPVSSVLMPSQGWDAPSLPGSLGDSAEPSVATDDAGDSGAWDASSGYVFATCTDPMSGCSPQGTGCQNGHCTSGCHAGGLADTSGLYRFLGHSKNACWTLRSDAILLWRNAPESRPIYSTIDPATGGLGPTALNADEMNSDVLAAPRLSLMRTDAEGRTLEATYIYAGNFYSDRTMPYVRNGYVTSPPGIFGNDWGSGGTELNTATATLIGQLQSLEFNARHCLWNDTCQFLIGPRWLQWNETLRMKDSFSAPPPPDPISLEGKDVYQSQCFNNLWGGQIGLDALILGRVGLPRVEGLVKAGAYYNKAGQASTYRYSQNDGFAFSNQARAGGPAAASFVGEVGLTAVVPLSCNCDFRCGYFGLWLTNLAQPTNQLSDQRINQFDSVPALDTSSCLVLQGLSLGLEGRW
jgi:hypothetical protein